MRISDWSSDVCSSDLGHDDDADASEPLQDGAPQQDAGGREVQSDDHRGAGGGDARHRLEEGVDRIELELRKLERQRAEDDDDQPREVGQQERLADGKTFETGRSEEHTSEFQSLMRISYAVFCLQKKNEHKPTSIITGTH